MIKDLDKLFEGSGQPGAVELRTLLQEILGGPASTGQFLELRLLQSRHPRVYRLRFASIHGEARSLVVKWLEPGIARRNELVINRWLPAVSLANNGPILLGAAAERTGQCVWHVYQDLGDWQLVANDPEPERVRAAVALIAQIHTRFAEHPLLPECRLGGADLGIH